MPSGRWTDTRLAGLKAAQRMLKRCLGPHKTVDWHMRFMIREERERTKPCGCGILAGEDVGVTCRKHTPKAKRGQSYGWKR